MPSYILPYPPIPPPPPPMPSHNSVYPSIPPNTLPYPPIPPPLYPSVGRDLNLKNLTNSVAVVLVVR